LTSTSSVPSSDSVLATHSSGRAGPRDVLGDRQRAAPEAADLARGLRDLIPVRETSATSAPSSAKRSAIERPMPRPAR
jgi:hypothetical protein